MTSIRLRAACAAAIALLAASPAFAVVQLFDEVLPAQVRDFRPGGLLPDATQLARVEQLGGSANWNKFGTVHSLIHHGGYLGQGYAGTAVEGARAWIRDNRVLFKLSDAGVDDLELVNDGQMPFTKAHAVLFRQTFGGLHVTHDGLITVGIVDGKVYYASSSSAGDQPPPSAVVISPVQAWLNAAADVNRRVDLSDVVSVRDATEQAGWQMLQVTGFAQVQRVRLAAIPIPAGGVRQAYETIVLDSNGGAPTAWVHFIDAETGAVLLRENRVNYQVAGMDTQTFQGALPDDGSCAARHEFAVKSGYASLQIVEAAANTVNDTYINLYYVDNGQDNLVATGDLATSPETATYSPSGGVPEGAYQVEICSFDGAAPLPPADYAGVLILNESSSAVPDPRTAVPQWSWFPSNPSVTYDSTDTRAEGCFGPGCDFDFTNIAARQPWDFVAGELPTFTTMGNAALTAEAWLSPLSPAEQYRPVSPTRTYDFPFTNAWHESGCSPTELVPGGNDIDAVTTNLFVTHNRMHDWAYLLGFTERNYNLQLSNFGLTSTTVENDPELGNVQAGAIDGNPAFPNFYTAPGRDNANQITLQDGVPGITNQYLFQPVAGIFYTPCTDGSLDTGVVGHEYTHAISNRMIGGPDQSIGGQQGGSMGESWSDLDATEYQLANGLLPDGSGDPLRIGPYATGGEQTGIRDYRLDDSPLNYSNLGFDTPGPEVHADGEIWNATQWDVRQALVDKWQAVYPYEDRQLQQVCADAKRAPENCPGNRRWIQLMFDSFLLMPAAPSMLDARDAMLAADQARFGGEDLPEMWRAFARRGMGEFAYSNTSEDTHPVGNFESPLADDEAVVHFTAHAADEGGASITNAKLYIGQYATRTRHIADTDPGTVVDDSSEAARRSTLINRDTFAIIPGTYDLVVEAPGYGIHRYRRTLESGEQTLDFQLASNWASLSRGAGVAISASLEENQALKDTLIDDTENTGVRIGDEGQVEGATATVALAGGAHEISRVSISTAAGPANGGRFTGVRQFEIRTCNGDCSDPQADFDHVAYTSPEDAFPAGVPRPLQPNLILRSFDFPPVTATHVQLRVLTSQCTGAPAYAGEQDNDPLTTTDCATTTPPPVIVAALDDEPVVLNAAGAGTVVRATEFQVYGASYDDELDAPPASVKTATAVDAGGRGNPLSAGVRGGALGGGILLLLLVPLLRRRTR